MEDGSVADERAAVDRHELAEWREDDLELAVGRALVAAEDREHPEHAAVDRVHHRRRVVVVGPHADRVLAGRQPVGPRLADLHLGVAPGDAGHVGAVGAGAVVHAVEVHRVRSRRSVSMFLKWIRSRSPARAWISGPGISSPSELSSAPHSLRLAPVRREAAVDDRGKTESSMGIVIPMIASRPLGTMLRRGRHRRDPVVQRAGGRGAGEAAEAEATRTPASQGPRTARMCTRRLTDLDLRLHPRMDQADEVERRAAFAVTLKSIDSPFLPCR